MAVCKFCGKIIEKLELVRTGVEKARFFINEKGLYDYEGETFDSNGDFLEFKCLECGETLFEDYEEAEQFLKDKDELQEIVAEKLKQIKEKNKNVIQR